MDDKHDKGYADEHMAEDCDEIGDETMQEGDNTPHVYIPGDHPNEVEELVYDETAYIMYHQAQTGAPCLSFDILHDGLGDNREDFPLTCYSVSGTQASASHTNHVIVMKMSNMQRTRQKKEADDSDEDSESEDEDELPELETAMIQHSGCVNRIRAVKIGDKSLAATWSENGKVYVWDLSRPLNAVNDSSVMALYTRTEESPPPVYTFSGHQTEGYALDWSNVTKGRLITGDCSKNIHIWNPQDGGSWHVDQRPYKGHTDSVEDIQWSPVEDNVFASCSVDRSIRIWDARASPAKACKMVATDAHQSDINVIHWNRNEPFIVSGGDDGFIKVWDLRLFQEGKSVASFKHHTGSITSVEWHPTDSTVFAASGSDDQISIWDLAVERDVDNMDSSAAEPDVPPQLLFIHQGQTDVKELHWHSQLTSVIMSTAHSSFNIFRTISV